MGMSKRAADDAVYHPVEAIAKRRGIKISDLAERSGVRRVKFHQVFRGEREFSDREIGRIARVLGVERPVLTGPKRKLVDVPAETPATT